MSKTKKTGTRKARRTPAQIAATRRMVAANKAKRAGKKPAAKRAAPKASAPAKKRSYKRPSAAGVKVVYKRNPVPAKAKGLINGQIIPAAEGAAGALAFDVVWGKLPLPAKLRTGYVRHGVRGVGAIALGFAADKFTKGKARGHVINGTTGIMTMVLHGAATELAKSKLPQLGLGEADEVAGLEAMIEDLNGMGAVIEGEFDTVGDWDDAVDNMGEALPDGMGDIGFYQAERHDSAAY